MTAGRPHYGFEGALRVRRICDAADDVTGFTAGALPVPLPPRRKNATRRWRIRSAAEYRYGDSNPGFRTENPRGRVTARYGK